MAQLALHWCQVEPAQVRVLPVCVQVPEQRRPSRVWALMELQTHWLEWLSSAWWPTCLQCTDRNWVNFNWGNFKLHYLDYFAELQSRRSPTDCRQLSEWTNVSAPPPAAPEGKGNCHGPLEQEFREMSTSHGPLQSGVVCTQYLWGCTASLRVRHVDCAVLWSRWVAVVEWKEKKTNCFFPLFSVLEPTCLEVLLILFVIFSCSWKYE